MISTKTIQNLILNNARKLIHDSVYGDLVCCSRELITEKVCTSVWVNIWSISMWCNPWSATTHPIDAKIDEYNFQ